MSCAAPGRRPPMSGRKRRPTPTRPSRGQTTRRPRCGPRRWPTPNASATRPSTCLPCARARRRRRRPRSWPRRRWWQRRRGPRPRPLPATSAKRRSPRPMPSCRRPRRSGTGCWPTWLASAVGSRSRSNCCAPAGPGCWRPTGSSRAPWSMSPPPSSGRRARAMSPPSWVRPRPDWRTPGNWRARTSRRHMSRCCRGRRLRGLMRRPRWARWAPSRDTQGRQRQPTTRPSRLPGPPARSATSAWPTPPRCWPRSAGWRP